MQSRREKRSGESLIKYLRETLSKVSLKVPSKPFKQNLDKDRVFKNGFQGGL